MTETQKAARLNITIPAELKARMDAVPSENWSAIAAAAFKQRLLELDSRMEATTVDKMIARLKATDELENSNTYQEGRVAGEQWAQQRASSGQLRNLPQLRNLKRSMDEVSPSLPKDPAGPFAGVARDAALDFGPGVGWHLYFGMLGRRRPVTTWAEVKTISAAAEAFWESVLGDDKFRIESALFGQGFVDGALGIWELVKDKV